jgi:hypothetical protein
MNALAIRVSASSQVMTPILAPTSKMCGAFPRCNYRLTAKDCHQELLWIAPRPGDGARNPREGTRNTRQAGYYLFLATNCLYRTPAFGDLPRHILRRELFLNQIG